MKWLESTKNLFVLVMSVVSLAVWVVPTGADEGASEQKKNSGEVAVSVWDLPKEDGVLVLSTFGQSAPVKTTLTAETRIEGVCSHCEIAIKCAVSELKKHCGMCPCGLSNAQCLTGKATSQKSWAALLQDLPRGTLLHVEYSVPDKLEAGVKRLNVDRHGALLPIEGLTGTGPEQLQALGKSVGALRTELSASGNCLRFSLKDNWTADKELRLEKALAKLGAKVMATPPDPLAP